MSSEQRLIPTTTRRAEQHSYFVGRRKSEAEVYEVTVTNVERLRSTRGARVSNLDWHGSEAARMELSQLLISRVTAKRPSRDLKARFAVYVLRRLPAAGFVLGSDDVLRWIRIAGES
jgi:hypothetical protein